MKSKHNVVFIVILAAVGLCAAIGVASMGTADPVEAFRSPLPPPLFQSPLPLPEVLWMTGESPLAHDVIDRDTGTGRLLSNGFAPDWSRTSDFMIGRVVVSIVLPDSNGEFMDSTEDWDQAEINFVRQEIQEALQWWADQAETYGVPPESLEFVIPPDHPILVETGYEPIEMIGLEAPYGEADIWISDTMAHLGYDDPGMDYLERVQRYDDDSRKAHQADWAVTILVTDASYDDAPGWFAPGSWGLPDVAVTAWASRPGPHLVANDLSGVAQWGDESWLGNVVAHEIGHVFGAADEVWAGGGDCSLGSECDTVFGYLSIENQNCDSPSQCALDVPNCVMRVGELVYLCPYSAGQVGWEDSDQDGLPDPIDTYPELTITDYPITSPSYVLDFSAEIEDIPWPTTHPSYISVTINTVSVQFQVGSTSGTWLTALPGDGAHLPIVPRSYGSAP